MRILIGNVLAGVDHQHDDVGGLDELQKKLAAGDRSGGKYGSWWAGPTWFVSSRLPAGLMFGTKDRDIASFGTSAAEIYLRTTLAGALTKNFYLKLATGSKRNALRQARSETRQAIPQPFCWAAFQLTGRAE